MTPYRQVISFSRPPHDIISKPAPSREEALQDAYERGRQDGENRLRQQLLQQRQELMQLEQGLLESLRELLPRLAQEGEQAMTTLCLEVAQKLVFNTPITVDMVSGAIQEALSQIQDANEYNIDIHPEDWALLEKFDSPLLQNNNPRRLLQFHQTPDIARGGVQVRTRFGLIDARRETKLELIKQTLAA